MDIPKSMTEVMSEENRKTCRGDMWRSRKLKNHHHALRYHYCCDFLYRIGYVSKCRPPTECDGKGIIAEQDEFEKAVDEQDVVLGGDSYRMVGSTTINSWYGSLQQFITLSLTADTLGLINI